MIVGNEAHDSFYIRFFFLCFSHRFSPPFFFPPFFSTVFSYILRIVENPINNRNIRADLQNGHTTAQARRESGFGAVRRIQGTWQLSEEVNRLCAQRFAMFLFRFSRVFVKGATNLLRPSSKICFSPCCACVFLVIKIYTCRLQTCLNFARRVICSY